MVELGGWFGYEEWCFVDDEKCGWFRFVVVFDGGDGVLLMWVDVCIFVGLIDGDEMVVFDVLVGCSVYVYVVCGEVEVNGCVLVVGDGVWIGGVDVVVFVCGWIVEVLLFDVV